jgi:predicted RNase H-like HicB family nuclease
MDISFSKPGGIDLLLNMLTEYIQAAMRQAHYEIVENGRFFGEIPQCPGSWGEGATLEEAREELRKTLESWIIVGLRHGDRFEVIEGIDLNPRAAYAEADQTA